MNTAQELKKLRKKFRKLEEAYDKAKGQKKDKILHQAERLQERIDTLTGG